MLKAEWGTGCARGTDWARANWTPFAAGPACPMGPPRLAKAQPGAPGLAEQLLRVGNRAGDPAQGGGWVPRAGRRWQGRRGGEEGGWRRSDRRGAGHGKCDVSAEPSYTSFPSRGAAQPPVPRSSAPPEPVAEPPAMSGVKKQKTVGSAAFPEEVRWWGVPGRRRRTRAPSGDPRPACWLGTRLFWGAQTPPGRPLLSLLQRKEQREAKSFASPFAFQLLLFGGTRHWQCLGVLIPWSPASFGGLRGTDFSRRKVLLPRRPTHPKERAFLQCCLWVHLELGSTHVGERGGTPSSLSGPLLPLLVG